ncbi:MAG: hypothetical protein IJL87_06040 [Clostridia bacterium]|nr:hypothetical protein [Clostridia bacterium]
MNAKISQSQLFVMLILSGMTDILSFSHDVADGAYNSAFFVSLIAAFVLRLLLLIPIFFLYKNGKRSDFPQGLGSAKTQSVISVAVIVLLTALACGDGIKFCYFTVVCIAPDMSDFLLSLTVTAGAVYCALKGRQGLFRASGIITAAVLFTVGLMFLIMLQNTSKTAFASLVYEFDANKILPGAFRVIAGSSSLPIITLLCFEAKGKLIKGVLWWNGTITLFALVIALVTGSVLGVFGEKTPFPVYMAVNSASVGILERFDALFLCAFTLGTVIRLGVLLCLVRKLSGRGGKAVFFICALAVLFVGTAGRSIEAARFFNNALFRFSAITAICAGLPALTLAKRSETD